MFVMNKSFKALSLIGIRSVKTASTKPSKKGGTVVKRINSENKDLFGKLLETRKERREYILKHESSIATSDKRVKDNAEAAWQTSINSDRVLKLRTNNDDEESLVKAALDNSMQRKQFVPSLGPTTKIVKNYFRSSNNANVDDKNTKKKLVSTTSVTNKKAVKLIKEEEEEPKKELLSNKGLSFNIQAPALLLPDSVIQNITSFPMLNLVKSEVTKGSADVNSSGLVWKYPSVSKVLNATMSDSSRAALARWRSKLTQELGEEGFNEYYRAQLNRGSQFHSMMQNYLSGQPLPTDLDPEVEACWTSLSYMLGSVSDVAALERPVVHSQLLYKGVIDCVAKFNGEPVVVEWKKSAKQKPQLYNTYDAPLQLAAYLGAMNFDPTYNIKVSGGLVAVAYSDGTPAQVFRLSFEDFTPHWKAWLNRLQKFWIQQSQVSKELKIKKLS